MARKTARGGKYVNFKGRMIMVGFGSIGQGVLPLILRHIGIKPSQITIIADEMRGGIPEAKRYGVEFIEDDELVEITPKSIRLRKRHLKEHERKRASREAV